MLLECINTSVWNLFIIPEEDWSQSKSIEEYEVNKFKNEDGYSCFYAFVQLPGHSSKTVRIHLLARRNLLWDILRLLSSRIAVLGLYVNLMLWQGRGTTQPPYALLFIGAQRACYGICDSQ